MLYNKFRCKFKSGPNDVHSLNFLEWNLTLQKSENTTTIEKEFIYFYFFSIVAIFSVFWNKISFQEILRVRRAIIMIYIINEKSLNFHNLKIQTP